MQRITTLLVAITPYVRSFVKTSRVLPMLILCLFFGSKIHAATEIGYVIEARGAWYDNKYQQLVIPMYLVREDSQLVRKKSAGSGDYIRIRSFMTGKEERFDCKEPLTCNSALDLSGRFKIGEARGQTNALVAFLKAISILVSGHPEAYQRYARALSRTPSSGKGLVDGVARIEADRLDLENIFRDVAPNTYLIEMCVVNESGEHKCGDIPAAFPFLWKQGGNALWKGPVLRPGLYKLNLCEDVEGRVLRSTESVFVIMATADKYDRLQSEFENTASQARAWSTADPSDPVALSVLRAYMQYLNFYENQ